MRRAARFFSSCGTWVARAILLLTLKTRSSLLPPRSVRARAQLKTPIAREPRMRLPKPCELTRCAQFAKSAGFDGVELHADNGYLIDGFLQSCSIDRTDIYGGSFENRFRFLKEILVAVSEVFQSNRVGVRLGPNGAFGGMGSADNDVFFRYAATQMQPLGLPYLHVLNGLGFGEHDKCRLLTLFDIKQCFQGVVMGIINYTRDTAEGAIASGAAELISFGRPFTSNPDLVERFRNNWPLADPAPYPDWRERDGAEGYTDYPAYSVVEKIV